MSELDRNIAEAYGDCKLELSKWTLGIDRKAPEAYSLAPRESSQAKILARELAASKTLGPSKQARRRSFTRCYRRNQ